MQLGTFFDEMCVLVVYGVLYVHSSLTHSFFQSALLFDFSPFLYICVSAALYDSFSQWTFWQKQEKYGYD